MSTFEAFARRSASGYLQTAVFIDDKIFVESSGMALNATDLPTARKPVYQREASSPPPTVEIAGVGDEEQPYKPKDLVSSFAREGIICALYEPPEGFATDPHSEIFRLCERSDIIVLDWDFSGDKGHKALDLIAALVKHSQEEFPHHTRLLTIYTADPSLVAVANRIADRLKEDGYQPQPENSQCRLRAGATRLVVFGKDISRIGSEEESFTVKEKHLANRLIEEFAEMNRGILPSYALHGMALLRRNSKRILDRFHGDMDAAFLLHRAMVMEDEEAFRQLPELLAEELLAVLEEDELTSRQIRAYCSQLANKLVLGKLNKPWCDKDGKAMDATAAVRNLLKTGCEGVSDADKKIKHIQDIIKNGWRRIRVEVVQDFQTIIDPKNNGSNQRLASLFSTRTQYNNRIRHLCYGTVVRHRESKAKNSPWIYSFCLMPLCDGLRLTQSQQYRQERPVPFPFWQLKQDIYSSSSANRRGVVTELNGGSYVELSAGGKPRDMLWLAAFSINKKTGTVTAARKPDGRFVFSADAKRKLEWVAQLKPLHAQRIAHDIGQSFSRVGVLEAEWLRLLCDR